MNFLLIITICFYILSTVGYITYLFLQKHRLYQSGFYLLAAGCVCHTIAIGMGYVERGHLPVNNLPETLSIAAWSVAGVFLVFQYRFRLKILGIYAAPLASLILVVSHWLPREPAQTQTLFFSIWLPLHIISIFIGEAAFALACGVGILYIVQERAIKMKKHGFFYKRLPSLDLIDTTGYACIVVGFTLLTTGLITGLVYAKMAWGRFWGWDPKEIWSGITWLLYAAVLHGRIAVGWRGRRAAIMAIVGFAVLLFTFFGVNFFLKGHHGVFTQFK
jgi:cytochrome c-type biogenesis protein CcsB